MTQIDGSATTKDVAVVPDRRTIYKPIHRKPATTYRLTVAPDDKRRPKPKP